MKESQKAEYRYSTISYPHKPLTVYHQNYETTRPSALHFHNCYEILLIEQGKYKVYAPKNVYEGEGPALVFFNLGTYHGCIRKECEDVSFKCYVFYYQKNILDSIPAHMVNAECLNEKDVHICPLDKETLDFLVPMAQNLCRSYIAHKYEDDIPSESYGYLLVVLNKFAELVRNGKAISFDGRTDGDNYIYNVVKDIMELVEEGKDVSIQQIAEKYFVSNSKLSKDFRRTMGMTVKSMAEELTVERIKAMLKKGVSNTDVAAALGFSSESYFVQFFSKYANMSPGSYRKLYAMGNASAGNDENEKNKQIQL